MSFFVFRAINARDWRGCVKLGGNARSPNPPNFQFQSGVCMMQVAFPIPESGRLFLRRALAVAAFWRSNSAIKVFCAAGAFCAAVLAATLVAHIGFVFVYERVWIPTWRLAQFIRWSPFWALPDPLGTGHLDEKRSKTRDDEWFIGSIWRAVFSCSGDACALRLRELVRAVERSPVASLQKKGSSEPF